LTARATNDDHSPVNGQLWSRVEIEVLGGTRYNIAVDGWGGTKGQVKLSWAFTAVDYSTRPTEPRSVTVNALDGSGLVKWEAPSTLGSGTITYTATAQPGAASCTTAGLHCLIKGLENGTTYSVTVVARNTAGEGPASNPPVTFTPNTATNRPVQTRAWGLDRVDQRTLPLDGMITRTSSGRAVSLYVVDTGVLASHNEFGTRVVQGRNTLENAPNPNDTTDCNGHGTHVAGTAAGQTFGVAPEATIIPVKVLNCFGSGTLAGVVAGLDWIVSHHQAGVPAVANLSLGGSSSVALNQAVARAVADGITVVVAAGNSALDACLTSPGSEPLAVTVGATDRSDARASYSNYGSCVDVFAPGSGILSAGIVDARSEATLSGTSMASPHVAGAAALILDAAPLLSPAEVAGVLTARATRNVVVGPGTGSPNLLVYVGSGTNASGASTPTTPAPTTTVTTVPATPAPTTVPATTVPATTVPATTAPATTVPATTVPATTAPATTVPAAVETSAPTTIARANETVQQSPNEQLRYQASDIGILDVTGPQATVVRSSADQVLVRISNARGSVDVFVDGKKILRTKKRVLLLKSKGIGKKRVTVRASSTK